MTGNRGRMATSSLVALGLVLAGCGSGDRDAPAAVGDLVAEPTVTAEQEVVAEAAPTATVGEEPVADEVVAPLPDPPFQQDLRDVAEYVFGHEPGLIEADFGGYAPHLLGPGTYTTDAMVTPMTFSVEDHWRLINEFTSFMVLVDHEAASGLWDLPLLQFNRPESLTDPDTTSEGPPGFPGRLENWDFDAWFEAHPGLDVVRTEFDVGGITAQRYDIAYGTDSETGWECGPGTRCTPLVIMYNEGPLDLLSDELIHLWVIPQGDAAPITALAVADPDVGWDGFDTKVEELMAGIEFGEARPVSFGTPLWEAGLSTPVPAGPVWLPILGGVRFDLAEDSFVAQNAGWSWIELEGIPTNTFPPNIEVAAAVETIDGIPIASAEELAALLVDQGGGVRLDDAELVGAPAVVVDMRGVQPGLPLFRHVDVGEGVNPGIAAWSTLDYVQVWAVDTPEGVLILTGEADSDAGLDQVMEAHAALRETLVLEPR